jgi:K+-sensing histidine kinase KdpD
VLQTVFQDVKLITFRNEIQRLSGNNKVQLFIWLPLSILCIATDYITGPVVQFPVLFLIPVALASWYSGRVWGIAASLVLPLIRMLFIFIWTVPWTLWESLVNTGIRMFVFTLFAVLIERTARQQKQLSHKIRILEGMLPVCCICKKIRTDKGDWEQIEKYITEHSEAEFSHGLCPECAHERYPDLFSIK